MNKITKSIVAAAFLVSSSSAFAANQIIVSTQPAKGGTLIGLDVVGDGAATGLQFSLVLPKGATANISNVKAGVASHQAFAVNNSGEVRVASISATNAPLPTTVTSFGTVFVSGGTSAKAGGAAYAIRNVEFADASGKALDVSATIDGSQVQVELAK